MKIVWFELEGLTAIPNNRIKSVRILGFVEFVLVASNFVARRLPRAVCIEATATEKKTMMKRVEWEKEKLVSQDAANQEKVINLHQKPPFIRSFSPSDTSCSSFFPFSVLRITETFSRSAPYGTDCYFSVLTH